MDSIFPLRVGGGKNQTLNMNIESYKANAMQCK